MKIETRMTVAVVAMVAAISTYGAPLRADPDREKLEEKVAASTEVYQTLLSAKDKDVPQSLLKDARCIAVIPHTLKGAIGYGARHGSGIMTCRNADGTWGPISFVKLTGGSIGFQIGAESTDYVLFFMSDKSVRSLLKSKFTLGGKASVAAGPFGRSGEADTDLHLNAEIYSYAKSKGLFAGVSLEGAKLRPDDDANRVYYGQAVMAEHLLLDHRAPNMPSSEQQFLSALP